MDITILGIESSCDDTSAAVLRGTTLLSNVIASQAVHVKYGGVIPELASRAHQQNIIPVVDTVTWVTMLILLDNKIYILQIDILDLEREAALLLTLLARKAIDNLLDIHLALGRLADVEMGICD